MGSQNNEEEHALPSSCHRSRATDRAMAVPSAVGRPQAEDRPTSAEPLSFAWADKLAQHHCSRNERNSKREALISHRMRQAAALTHHPSAQSSYESSRTSRSTDSADSSSPDMNGDMSDEVLCTQSHMHIHAHMHSLRM